MNILIITEKKFPYGSASTNRIISYAKGLAELSNNVQVICFKPSEEKNAEAQNVNPKGEYGLIKYRYITGLTVKSSNAFIRAFSYLKAIILTSAFVWSSSKGNKIDVLFLGILDPFTTLLLYLETRIFKIKFVHERSEYPFLGIERSIISKLNYWIYIHFTIKLFDGLIVITKSLKTFFKGIVKNNIKITILPMLVEPERFNMITNNINQEDYIAFCGELSGNKDGIPILIDSFSEISKKYPSCKLFLIGDINFEGFERLITRINELNLTQKVVFTGKVNRDEVPALLANAKILLLARPTSKQAEGGFPTKLGEYLATGNPVVVTKTGEIDNYLIHKQNAFLVEPDSITDFAEKLDEALTNYEEAKRIGKNGQKLAYNEFNYKVQSKKLLDFLKSL